MKETETRMKVRKILSRPFTYLNDSVGTDSVKMAFLLGIQIVMLFLTKSYASLSVILSAALASVAANLAVFYLFDNFKISDSFQFLTSAVQGVITGMLIPENFPPLAVFFVTFFVMLISRHIFGGFARAWINSSALTVAVLWIVASRLFPSFLVTAELLQGRNPSQTMIENGLFQIYRYDSSVTEALNSTLLSLFKVSVPEGYISLFWDTKSAIPAFRFNLITLLSSVVLFSDDLVKGISSFSYLAVYLVLVRFLSPVLFGAFGIKGDVLLALLTGGTLFCAVFVLGWYGTVPSSIAGKIIYGSAAGISSFFISGAGTSPCGMVFTVLVVNIISVIICQFEMKHDRKRMEKYFERREAAENGADK